VTEGKSDSDNDSDKTRRDAGENKDRGCRIGSDAKAPVRAVGCSCRPVMDEATRDRAAARGASADENDVKGVFDKWGK
jgi:hypothetical protein